YRDVAEREARIRQDERELRAIVDFLPQLLVVGDAQGVVEYANRATLEFTGRTLKETVNTPTFGPRSSIRTTCLPRGGPSARSWKGWGAASSSFACGEQTDSIGGSSLATRRCATPRAASLAGSRRASTSTIASAPSSACATRTSRSARRWTRRRCSKRSWA